MNEFVHNELVVVLTILRTESFVTEATTVVNELIRSLGVIQASVIASIVLSFVNGGRW